MRTTTRHPALPGFLAALAWLATAAGADATDLQTDILFSNANTEVDYKCTLTNLGKDPVDAHFRMVNSSGVVENEIDVNNIGPGATGSAFVHGDDAAGVHCNVSGKFSKSKARVTLQLIDEVVGTNGITRVIVPGN
jgi:hypothetical protein